ncbi:hemin-degrading factor [Poseidonocella sedimentorum]|uniref:Putative hemin transport protein n=1 Tax=Poseidonocella sedimentorum TaxID=871652 RepID=A0A1I6DIB8_9RHOB|nr:ChuX/HutX family heme-like substrate-binding protein [Poseidonocella sedimentorum]SFR05205.1 putative hemin transport protein [Poseidonocella sedimentorum]
MMTGSDIRAARRQHSGRARDIAEAMGVSEAQLVASGVGEGTTAIGPDPNQIVPLLEPLGPCMALTRNPSCVIEKDGIYSDFHGGDHACMTLSPQIDLRMFPKHWVYGYAVEEEVKGATRRSVQVFDASGTAVHKTYLREGADLDAWSRLTGALALDDQSDTITVSAPPPPEGARMNPEKREILLQEWARLTDTHQFLRLCAKLRMNRLGAYRIAEAPFVRPLAPTILPELLETVRAAAIPVMIFVGNRGCIEIHSGPIGRLQAMGPWENVLDPGFNLHLRGDHVAEVWAVEKPTHRGPALSVEAFDAEGNLILQLFPVPKPPLDSRAPWAEIVAGLRDLEPA